MKIQFIVLFLFTIACSNPKNTEKVEVLSPPSPQKATSSNVQKLLRTIIGTDGLLRGTQLGDAISDVKKKEKAELFEEEESHIGYTFDTENLETVDILYEKDKQNRVIGMELDIYMNTDVSNESLKNEMVKEFTTRFGKSLADTEDLTWNLKPKGRVTIKVIKNKLDRGLEIKFSQDSKAI
jgi:hypothetical protein